MAEKAKMAPGFAKYCVSEIRDLCVETLPDKPRADWSNQSVLVSEKDITKVFEGFKTELGEVKGLVNFVPRGWENKVKVYFNPQDLNSLHYVVPDEQTGDEYAVSLGLRKPFNAPERDRRSSFNWPGTHRQLY